MVVNFLTKVPQIIGELGYFEIHHFLSKKWYGYFFGNHWKTWATFYSIVWTHWLIDWHLGGVRTFRHYYSHHNQKTADWWCSKNRKIYQQRKHELGNIKSRHKIQEWLLRTRCRSRRLPRRRPRGRASREWWLCGCRSWAKQSLYRCTPRSWAGCIPTGRCFPRSSTSPVRPLQ